VLKLSFRKIFEISNQLVLKKNISLLIRTKE